MAGGGAAVAQTRDQTQGQTASLEEIIVTGEKTDRSLQDTPTSVRVVTARQVEQETIQTLGEIFQRTANLSETYGHAGFTIRGVNNQGVSGGGDAALTTIYVDGAPLPPSVTFSGPTDAWDMRQIEIFRGPQSTLQGLNALAGAVVMRTVDPTFDWDLRGRAIVADPQETAFAIAGGGPLIADELAFRLAAEKRDSDGYTHNETLNAPEDPIDSLTVRGRLLWTPKSLPGFEARLGYTRFESDGGYLFAYTNTDVPDFYDKRRAYSDTPNLSHVETDMATLELNQVLSDTLTLSSVTSWSDIQQFQQYDGDGTAAAIGYGYNDYDYDTLTQEVRLNYRGERIHGLLGAFYYNRDQQANSASRTNVQTPVNTISAQLQSNGVDTATADIVANLYSQALPVIPVNYAADFPTQVTTYALFGDGEWNLTDRLSVVGGFRWDHEENTTQVTQSAIFAGTYPDPRRLWRSGLAPLPGCRRYQRWSRGPCGQGRLGHARGQARVRRLPAETRPAVRPDARHEGRFRGAARISFRRLQRQHRAQSKVFAYDPEYTWNYEASLRSTWLDGALTVNANAYYVDWTDQQVSVNFGLNLYDYNTVNAGKSHLYGFEFETAHRLNSAFDWYTSVGFSRTKFDEFVTNVGGASSNLSGSEFSYAPRWTLALGGNYRWGAGFVANFNANYRSEVFTNTGFTQESSKVSGRTLVNGRVGYETERWGAYVYGKNLLDEQYLSYNREETNQAVLGDPRVIGLMLQARW